jgi:MFS family permease
MEIAQKRLNESATLRWLVLVLISGLMFSTYWFQDCYSGLKGLMETSMGFSSEEFGRIIGLTTIANVFGMIIIGGIILDKWGIKLAGIIFGVMAVLGGLISALGAYGYFGESHSAQLNSMIIGRILFGSGLEVVCVVCTRTIVKWFKGYELALAMAINVGFGRLGSAMGIALSIDIGGNSVPPAVAFAATLIGISLIFFLIYLIFDVKFDRQRGRKTEDEEGDEEFKFSDLVELVTNKSFIYIALLCVSFYAAVFPFMQYAPDLLINKFGFTSQLPTEGNYFAPFGKQTLGSVFIFLAMFIFGIAFSMIPLRIKSITGKGISIIAILAAFALFAYTLRDQFAIWFSNGPKTASLLPLATVFFTPIVGSYVDRKGKAVSLMIVGSLLLICAHVFLSAFNHVIFGYLGLVCLGIAFSLVPAAMWPSVAKIVAENRLGTAYASMFTVQNWGLLLFFWGIGAVLDLSNKQNLEAIRAGEMVYNYTFPIAMLVVCGLIAMFLAFKLKRADKEQDYGLELPFGGIEA